MAARPDRARRFAEALGPLVNTDHLDAEVLARYGRLEGLEATAPLHLALAQLQDLALVRRWFAGLPPGRRPQLGSGISPATA